VLISESQELQIGLKESKRVNTQLGVYPDDDLNAYLEELGLQIAHDSERPQIPWHFRVVESPAVNAFALPGGYIYFTRGILAHMNSEAALVGVLGHEIGHVTARHSVQQISREQLAGLGLGIGTLLVPEVQPFGDVLGGGLGLLFLKFGRDAERQSDELGVRYALAQGYDPNEMANFFAVLGRLGNRLDSYVPNWVSTR